MDFWSRLISHTPLSTGSSRKDIARDPARRLNRFEKEYSQLLQIWRNSSNLAHDEEAAENIEICLQELTNILTDESRRPLPHPCITFSAKKQIYVPVAKVATSSFNEWIVKEAVLFFATLIESEEEAFVENDDFSASLTNLLVRITGANSIRLGSDTEARVIELAFNITTKIRLDPEILPAWFKSQPQPVAGTPLSEKPLDKHEKFTGRTQKQDFPLFYLLIDYIHHEGKVGVFARTGLLYIIEAASSSVALEQWIVESDLSTLMATGLGALYSQLSRKLVIDHPAHDLPPVLAFSDYQHPKSNYEIISSCSFEFQAHIDTFLSHLMFWQDVLNHCRSIEVKSTLLEHFQVIFLQQLLYPSLLESSDLDGGSSVAVLTYLRRILEALDHPEMINLILHYLLALPDTAPATTPVSRNSVSAARKRKSMDLATMMAAKAEVTATPLLFNLVDLIVACLRSHSSQTIQVTLQLVSVILKRHHRYAIITLLHTEVVRNDLSHRTVGAHQQEVEFLLSLAGSIGGQDNFDEIYDNVLRDTTTRLEAHPCSLKLLAPQTLLSTGNTHKPLPGIPDSLAGAPPDLAAHTVRPDDPVLSAILDRLETFFVNPIETNLALTDVIFDMAVCGFAGLEGWFLRSPHKYAYDDTDGFPANDMDNAPAPDSPAFESFAKAQSMQQCRRRPRWVPSTLPRLLAALQRLVDQVEAYRGSVPRFEDLLQQRREAFQTADAAAAAASAAADRAKSLVPPLAAGTTGPEQRSSLEEEPAVVPPPVRVGGFEGFAQRILSELGTPSSRSGSPRGRKEATPSQTTTPVPIRGQHQLRPQHESPSRGGSALARSYSPGSGASLSGSYDSRGDAVASQMKAFAAVDQGILARRVGMPAVDNSGGRVKAIPLNFEKTVDPKLADAHDNGEEETDQKDDADETMASVSHVITNVVILQSFLFELASLVQARAGMFDEVRFA